MDKKQKLGQFNTTRKKYILNEFESFVSNKHWVDPFAGNGDLLSWAKEHNALSIEGYDIDKTKKFITRDTLNQPIDYTNKWVITNPPYLAKNKNKNKILYDKYNLDDLYKIAIKTISHTSEGGIIIVPVNFLSSDNTKIRNIFFKKYKILKCVVFEEQVFNDTDYTVCAIYFEKRLISKKNDILEIHFKPRDLKIKFDISEKYGWIAGEDVYKWIENVKINNISRFTMDNITKDCNLKNLKFVYINDFNKTDKIDCCNNSTENIILIRAIDSGTNSGIIKLENIEKYETKSISPILIGLNTSRNLAHVKFNKIPSKETQIKIINNVNKKLNYFRKKYNSMFLTSFRNSTNGYSRKRIGFNFMYKMICQSLLEIKKEI